MQAAQDKGIEVQYMMAIERQNLSQLYPGIAPD
jgi:hypothetical protein